MPALPANYSVARGSFQYHEVSEYYPMRMLVVSDPLDHFLGNLSAQPTFKYKVRSRWRRRRHGVLTTSHDAVGFQGWGVPLRP